MLSETDLNALWITLQLASVTTLILLVLGTPLAWWLAYSQRRFKIIIETLVAMPLILPPTVLGFYLLILLGPQGAIGELFIAAGGEAPAFRFSGLVIGSVIYSLPFVVQPLRDTFASQGTKYLEAAATLRASMIDRFFTVAIPMAKHGFLTAAVLGFSHTIGEFGVVLMIGGNIPGVTRVASIAIYDEVEALNYSTANFYAFILFIISFSILFVFHYLNKRIIRTF